ncbi:MAG: ABC transporter permease [Desulfobacteraceae bacterium]|jgi:putative ABC transport system permease protein
MFINLLKMTLRTLYREKVYAIINVAGLSIAIACCLILGLWLRSELTYDLHHKRHKEIYRIVNEIITSGNTKKSATTAITLGPLIARDYPEIKDFVRIGQPERSLIRSGDKAFYWDRVCSADLNIFDVFTHEIINGDPETALNDPSSVAVSESFAKKYFDDMNPVGKTISISSGDPRKITLVFKDLPENTHLKYDVLYSKQDNMDEAGRRHMLLYTDVGLYTYLVMDKDYDLKKFRTISESFYNRYMSEYGNSVGQTWNYRLQPLADIHLHSDLEGDLPVGNRYYVFGFTAVALFILLVACINYINLAIARVTRRGMEIGIRKILGVSRLNLISRFLAESMFYSLAALFIAVAVVEAVLKLTSVNVLLGKSLRLGVTEEPVLMLWMLGLSIFIGLLSGLYPALYLSSIAPLSVMKNNKRGINRKFALREVLVLVQFTVSVVVIACTLVMLLQMRFISGKPLGFEKDKRLVVILQGADVIEKYSSIKKELLKDSHIKGVAITQSELGTGINTILHSQIENEDGSTGKMILKFLEVGDDFIKVAGMELVSGRDFSDGLPSDKGKRFIVNEAMVKKVGWANPLGKQIIVGGLKGRVIGVVKDFNFESLHKTVEPIALCQANHDFSYVPPPIRPSIQEKMILHISGDDVQETLQFIENRMAEFNPGHPLEYEFLNNMLDKLYMLEKHLMGMTGIFSCICIFISCLGLFGLAAFTTEQRTKEIGLRKVLGASTMQIITMLSGRVLLLVTGGAVIASLIAYYAMDEWLAGFAYRTNIEIWVFFVSAVIAAGVALGTVALQSFKTAQANPVEALRYE